MATLLLFFTLSSLYATGPCENTGTTYVQQTDGEGLVVMEAEWPSNRAPSSKAGHGPEVNWTERTRSTAGNAGYTIVGTSDQNDYHLPAEGARLDYEVEFTAVGTYYIYFRHAAPSSYDNSIRVAIDGVWIDEELQFTPVSNWKWMWQRAGHSFRVDAVGKHTVTIYHREDGLPLDRMAISRNGARSFTGIGPKATAAQTTSNQPALTTLATYAQRTDNPQHLVVIEAERPTRSVRGQHPFLCQEWTAKQDAAASNNGYVTTPENNQRSDSFNLWQAPRLDYEIKFKRTGRHYIHLRHRGTSPGKNSVWTDFAYSDDDEFQFKKGSGQWEWETIGRDASFVVSDTGTYIFSMYMREDATPVDKIILTPDPNYRASNLGPATTECIPAIVYRQEAGNDHIVEMPAETPSSHTAGQGDYANLAWSYLTDANALGGKYAVVDHQGVNTKENSDGPALHYDIDFVTTGDHYLYLRHRSQTFGNSVKVYFDGVLLEGHAAFPVRGDENWDYTRLAQTINVTATGRHTLTIRMREDGTPLDHLVISTNPKLNAQSLPLEMADFTGTTERYTNLLTFTTTREDNTDRHLIERTAANQDRWETIGTLAAAGNSTETHHYSFTDRAPLATAYYRIRTIDVDGTESLSPIISLQREQDSETSTQVSIFPNPTTDRATLTFNHQSGGQVIVQLFSMKGRRVITQEVMATQGSNQVDLHLGQLPAGTYVLTAALSGQSTLRERIVVRH